MFFKKFHIVIFQNNKATSRHITMRGWLLLFPILFCVVIATFSLTLLQERYSVASLKRGLLKSQDTIQNQETQLISFAVKLKDLQTEIFRLQDTDSKIRVMVNLEENLPIGNTGQGGQGGHEFNLDALPLHRQETLVRKMHDFIQQLSSETHLEEIRQQEVMQKVRLNKNILEATPSIWPIRGWLTSNFGWRNSPFTEKRLFHKGLDIAAPMGTPIYAPASGKVNFAGNNGAYGISIKINHSESITTQFAHMSKLNVKKGQRVKRGDIIGFVGNTGRSTGPHLHYEVRFAGIPVNPHTYILD